MSWGRSAGSDEVPARGQKLIGELLGDPFVCLAVPVAIVNPEDEVLVRGVDADLQQCDPAPVREGLDLGHPIVIEEFRENAGALSQRIGPFLGPQEDLAG